ncbi:MAG: crossover junction endodeoxyribonuclease RuvC, partial [Dehalococcoidales bacterium]|nr:crossover junction endodeoxyribonuclease RuvC [Dehalococcoidales bacterium]
MTGDLGKMRVLGVDPGTITMGYGVIETGGDEITLVDYGALNTSTRSPIGERLSYLYNKLMEIISHHQP